MALFHFDVRHIKRSAGQSAIACAPIVPEKSCTATTMANGAITAAKAALLAPKSYSRIMCLGSMPTDRYYGTQLNFPSGGRKPSWPIALNLPCRPNFPWRRTWPLQGNFCWSTSSAGV